MSICHNSISIGLN